MNLPRVDWVRILVAVALAIGLWGWVHAAGKIAQANTYRAERERAEAVTDSALARADSMEALALTRERVADSASAAADSANARLARIEEEAREESARLNRALEALEVRSEDFADRLRAVVPEPARPLLDSLLTSHEAETDNLRAQLSASERVRATQGAALTRTRAALVDMTDSRDTWRSQARQEREARLAVEEELRLALEENDALRDARGAGIWAKVKPFALGMPVGALAWELIR